MSAVVVVGVDGSAEAAQALEYAAVEAARRGARLRVVKVIPLPEYWSVPVGFIPPEVPAPSWDLQPAAQEQAQSAVDALSAARPDLVRQIEIEPLGVCGRPTDELVERSRGADLLVVGHRGRGAVASALLGSVGLGCVLRARCPVTIVRPGRNTTPTASAAATSAPAAV